LCKLDSGNFGRASSRIIARYWNLPNNATIHQVDERMSIEELRHKSSMAHHRAYFNNQP
jgi:hypothetical protein